MKNLELQVKGIGEKRPIITKKIALENTIIANKLLNDEEILLNELIAEIVKLEVNEFNNKIKEKIKDKKDNILRYLTDNEVKDCGKTGKISIDSVKNLTVAETDKAIKTAILGFEDGLYYVFIDDKKIESIDEVINLHNDSVLMFLKLTFLSGSIVCFHTLLY